mgnify:CR=1 FL=1
MAEGWKTGRMGKVDLTLIRLAVYEMKYDEDVPVGVASTRRWSLPKSMAPMSRRHLSTVYLQSWYEKNIYSVGQVNTYIQNMFAQDFMLHQISIKGKCRTVSITPAVIFILPSRIRRGRSPRSCFPGTAADLPFR